MIKTITLKLSVDDYRKLKNEKETGKILNQWSSYEEMILTKCLKGGRK